VERMGSIGVGMGTDMNGLAQEPLPRFGPYACIARTRANGDDHARQVPGLTMRQTLRHDADAQEGGVTYDRPIAMARGHRFFGPVDIDDAPYDATERAVWIGIASCNAKKLGAPDGDLTIERDVVQPVAAGLHRVDRLEPVPDPTRVLGRADGRLLSDDWKVTLRFGRERLDSGRGRGARRRCR